jgi:GNAT superfamily N-acetyltransferase
MAFDPNALADKIAQASRSLNTPADSGQGLGLGGSTYEVGRQAVGGLAVDLPRMVGQAGRAVTDPDSVARRIFVGMQGGAEDRSQDFAPNPQAGNVTQFLGAGARGVAMGLPAIAATAVGAPVALPAIAMGGLMGLSGAQQTEDELRQQGVTNEDDITKAKLLSGGLNALAGGGAQFLGGKFLFPTAQRFLGGAAGTAEQTLAKAAVAPSFVKSALTGVAGDTGIMAAQSAGDTAILNAYGNQNKSVLDSALEGAKTGAAMGVVSAGSLGVLRSRQEKAFANHVSGALDALHDTSTTPEQFSSVLDGLSQVMSAKGVDPQEIQGWRSQVTSLREQAIQQEATERAATQDLLNKQAQAELDKQAAAAKAQIDEAQTAVKNWATRVFTKEDAPRVVDSLNAQLGDKFKPGKPLKTAEEPGATAVKTAWKSDPGAAAWGFGQAHDALQEARAQEAAVKAQEVAAAEAKARAKDILGSTSPNAIARLGELDGALRAGAITSDQHAEIASDLYQSKKFGEKYLAQQLDTAKAKNATAINPAVQVVRADVPTQQGVPDVGMADGSGRGPAGAGDLQSGDAARGVEPAGPAPVATPPAPVAGAAPVVPAVDGTNRAGGTGAAEGKPAAVAKADAGPPPTPITHEWLQSALGHHPAALLAAEIRLGFHPTLSAKSTAEAARHVNLSSSAVSKLFKDAKLSTDAINAHLATRAADPERFMDPSAHEVDGEGNAKMGDMNGNTDSSRRNLGAQSWFREAAEKGWENLAPKEFQALVEKAVRYDGPESRAALAVVIEEARRRAEEGTLKYDRRSKGEVDVEEPTDAGDGHTVGDGGPAGAGIPEGRGSEPEGAGMGEGVPAVEKPAVTVVRKPAGRRAIQRPEDSATAAPVAPPTGSRQKLGLKPKFSIGADGRLSGAISHDENGNPEFHNDKVRLTFPVEEPNLAHIEQDGEKVLRYTIMPAEGFDAYGYTDLVVKNGEPTRLLDIEVRPEHRGNDIARQAVEAVLAHTPKLEISNIEEGARGFWEKLGIPTQNVEGAYDGELHRETYEDARAEDVRNSGARRSTDAGAESGRASALGNRATPDSVRAELEPLRLKDKDGKLQIVQSIDDLPEDVRNGIASESPDGARVQGVVLHGTAYLIADHIAPGDARAVLLHEVGSHLGLDEVLTGREMISLTQTIRSWADRADGSIEAEVARRAMERVANAKTDESQALSELIAYTVEESVKAGVDPTAMNLKSELGRWLRIVVDRLKDGLRKLGLMDPKQLTAQDLVDMAYGAAHMALDKEGVARDIAPKFSLANADKAAPHEVADALDALAKKAGMKVSPEVREKYTNWGDTLAKIAPQWQTPTQLVARWGEKIPALKKFELLRNSKAAAQAAFDLKGKDAFVTFQHMKPADQKSLEALMMDTTRASSHADRPDSPFHDRFKKLSKDGQQVYKDLRDLGTEMLNNDTREHVDNLREMFNTAKADADTSRADSLKKQLDRALASLGAEKDTGPYFPLMREGRYWVTADSADLKKLRAESLANPQDAKLAQKVEAMEADDRHHITSAFETAGEQQKFQRELRADPRFATGSVQTRLKDEHLFATARASNRSIRDIEDLIATNFDPKIAAKMRDMLRHYVVNSMSASAAAGRRLARRNGVGVAGADPNMMRSFAKMLRAEGHKQAGNKFDHEIDAALKEVKLQANELDNTTGNNAAQHVYNVLQQHRELDKANTTESPLLRFARSAAYSWEIGFQPVRMALYMLQPHMLSVPVLGGEYGAAKALAAMNRATADTYKVFRSSKAGDGQWHGANGLEFDKALKQGLLNANEHKLLKSMQDDGGFNQGMHSDLVELAHAPGEKGKLSQAISKWKHMEHWAMGHVDATTRMMSALAAFRLELDKLGKNATPEQIEAAIDKAKLHTRYTQFEYGANSSALVMRSRGGMDIRGLFFQFRRYQQGALHMLFSEASKAFKGDTNAMKSLGLLIAQHALLAGALGIPGVQSIMALLNIAINDDDPNGDAGSRLRRHVYDSVGKTAGHALMDGILAPFGANIQHAVGMGNIITDQHGMPQGFGQVYRAKPVDKTPEAALAAFGPVGGFMERAWEALQLQRNGDSVKAFEELLPETLGDLLRASRYATQGISDGKGHIGIKPQDISAFEALYRAMGGTSEKEALFNEERGQVAGIAAANDAKRNALSLRYAKARAHGEPVDGILADVAKYNELHSGVGKMGRLTMGELAKSAQKFRMDESVFRTPSGAGYNPRKDRQLFDVAHTEDRP